ncbi:DUF3253 domain-containing protein [Pseudarthrobacter sp. TAF60_1]|uniref:DUF3253 domain-containing protein n=1 Tax=Pseudarthrobacter sp. TAF60_1 TaxID=3233071 RepID=UPI003F948240
MDTQLEASILELLAARAATSTICPSDAARATFGPVRRPSSPTPPLLLLQEDPVREAAGLGWRYDCSATRPGATRRPGPSSVHPRACQAVR